MRKPEDDGLVKGKLLVDLDIYSDDLRFNPSPEKSWIYLDCPGILVIEGSQIRFWAEGNYRNGEAKDDPNK